MRYHTCTMYHTCMMFDICMIYDVPLTYDRLSLEVKLPTYGQMQQQFGEQSEKRKRQKRQGQKRKTQKRKSQQKEQQVARKGARIAKHCVFPMFVALEGRKLGSLKRRAWRHPAG